MYINFKFISALTTLIIILFGSCDNKSPVNDNLRSVILVNVGSGANLDNKEYSGVIEEGKSVNASFMADGKIQNLYVKEGDRVRKGQLLASLDKTDYEIGLNQLKAQYNQMTEEKKRMDEMFKRHNIAPNDYEKFNAGYEQLKLQLQMMENKLGYTRLNSPSDGYISEKFMEPGELVGAGTPVFKITDDSRLLATVDLPVSTYISKDNIKQISGSAPAIPNEFIPLNIESFTPDASNNMLYKMKLSIPAKYSSALTSGMNIRVRIETLNLESKGNEIPSRAIFNENGTNYVWKFDSADSTIHKKKIIVEGVPQGRNINVKGLDGSELIVETGVKQLHEGEKVHPVNNSDFGL